MPSKRPRKRVKLAVDTIAGSNSNGNSNGSRDGMVEKSHHPPSPPPLLQQPIHYQQQLPQYQQQYHQYQHQQPHPPYQPLGYCMALPTDLELLEDFCAYLENRVLTKNLALLRRMLTEFLSRQELTLAQFKCFGANLIAVLPFDVLDQTKRAHADLLLQKKKHPLTDQTCAFEFLFARVATKNLAMLRQMFVEFRTHKESSIREFVKQGVAAISIVPYDPPHVPPVDRFAYNTPYAPQPPAPSTYVSNQFAVSPASRQQHYYQHQSYQQQYQPPQHAYYSQQQQHYAPQPYQHQHQPQYAEYEMHHQGDSIGVPGVTPKHERAKTIPTGSHKSHPAQDLSARSPIGAKAAANSVNSNSNNSNSNSSTAGAPAIGKRVVKKPVRYYKEQEEEELVAAVAKSSKRLKREQLATAAACGAGSTPSPRAKARKARDVNAKANIKTKKKQKASDTNSNNKTSMAMMDLDFSDSEEDLEDDKELELHELELQRQLSKANSGNNRTTDSMIDATFRQFEEHAKAEAKTEQRKLKLKHRKMERQRAKDEVKDARLRQQAAAEPPIASKGSAGSARVDDTALQIKTAVRNKLRKFEARQPWKQVFRDLPLPFDEQKAPKLADQLRLFWKVHARAVWERNFWIPLVQDGDAKANVARKGRQRLACVMFDAIVCDAFAAFGAEFFLKLDAQRHPGWWYRGPILDILAFRRVVGDKKCWAFVESQLCKRFPDCGLELPLKSPNYGVLRRHKSESAAMWSNVPKTVLILSKIVELKEQRARAKMVSDDGGDGDSNSSPSPGSNDPDASVEKEEEEEDEVDGSEAAKVLARDGNGQTAVNVPAGVDEAGVGDIGEGNDDGDDHGEDMILPLTTDTDAADDDDDEDDDEEDEEEELLIEKIALASSFETDDAVLQKPTAPGMAKTPSTTAADSAVDASAIADEGVIATALDGDAIVAEESGATAAAEGEIAASDPASAGAGDIASIVSDKNAGMAAGTLAREPEPARSAEFIRKIIPFGGGE